MTDPFGLALIVKATVVLLIALGAILAMPLARAARRALVLAAAFGVLFALPVASLVQWPVEIGVPAPLVGLSIDDPPVRVQEYAPLQPAGADATDRPAPVEPARSWALHVPAMLRAVWAAGAAFVLVPFLVSLWRLRMVARTALPWPETTMLVSRLRSESGIRRAIDVGVHERLQGPITCGLLRPAVLLPLDATQWPEHDARRALVHELEHVRRLDWLVYLVARAVCTLYWFHPLVWVAWRRLCLDTERACDDAVLREGDGDGYARQLVSLARRLVVAPRPGVGMAGRTDLAARVRTILNPQQSRGAAGKRTVAGVGGAACLLLVAIGPMQATVPSPLAFDAPAGHLMPQSADPESGTTVAQTDLPQRTAEEAQATTAGQTFDVVQISPATRVEAAQGTNERETFDAVSITENRSGSIPRLGQSPLGLNSVNVTVLYLIARAFGVPEQHVVGDLPSWVRTRGFDVTARASNVPLTRSRLLAMTRALLKDRFELDASYESAEGPVYALAMARADGRTGPYLVPSASTCQVDPPLEGPQMTPTFSGCGFVAAFSYGALSAVIGQRVTMRQLAAELSRHSRSFDRPVVDRTGLSGEFDVVAGIAMRDTVVATGKARFLTSLREHAGLTLREEQGSFEVLRIRRVEQPSLN